MSRREAVAILVVLLVLPLAGCASNAPATPLARDDIAVPVVSDIAGAAPTADGRVNVTGANGVTVAGGAAGVTVGLGNDVQAPGNVWAAGDVGVGDGKTLAFAANGAQNAATVTYDATQKRLEASSGIQAKGPLTGRVHVGTVTTVLVQDGEVDVVTAALEGLETSVFLRGSSTTRNGTAIVRYPGQFQALLGPGAITVQITPTSAGPSLFVAQKALDGFIAQTVTNHTGEITFDFFVQGTRIGQDAFDPVREDTLVDTASP